MKRIYKSVLIFVLCQAMIIALCGNVFAEEFRDSPSEEFKKLCSELFGNSTGYAILDLEGNDCTKDFLQTTKEFYSNADFEALYDYIAENNYTISWDKVSKICESGNKSSRSAMLITYKHEVGYSTIIDMPEFFNGKRAEVTYFMNCTYTANDSTQQIVRCSNPTVTVNFSPGDDFNYTQVSTSTPTPTISADRSSVTFKSKFSLKVHYQNSGVKYTYGPFYGKAVCYASGKYTQSDKW
jgi:hypothetical protein